MTIRVMLAENHTITREGLRMLLHPVRDILVVGEAADGREVIEMLEDCRPDVILMDIAMPRLNGIAATQQIREINPDISIIILSMYSDKEYVVKALESGADGYVLKDCTTDELLGAIRTVKDGKMYVTPEVTADVLDNLFQFKRGLRAPESLAELTLREKEILQLIAEECSSKDIAQSLDLSVRTVENYRRQIMDKLDIRSIAGLTKYAIRNGLVDLS